MSVLTRIVAARPPLALVRDRCTNQNDVRGGARESADPVQGTTLRSRDLDTSYVLLQLRPREWGLRQQHTYYDGPHCGYVVGPLHFYKSLGWCTKCMRP